MPRSKPSLNVRRARRKINTRLGNYELGHFVFGQLDRTKLIILPQPRRVFNLESLLDLADDVGFNQMIHEPHVALYSAEDMVTHLTLINKMWRRSFRLEEFEPIDYEGRLVYPVLLCGERRSRAYEILMTQGCLTCRSRRRGKAKNTPFTHGCLENHPALAGFLVKFRIGIHPIRALLVQIGENIHEQILPEENQRSYVEMYRLLKEIDPELTPLEVARFMGKRCRSSVVTRALVIEDMPEEIKKAVHDRTIPYGHAVELARIRDAGATDDELLSWLAKLITTPMTVTKFHRVVDEYLRDRDQVNIFSLQSAAELERHERQISLDHAVARVIGSEYAKAQLVLKGLRRGVEDGVIDQAEMPFARNPHRIRQYMGLVTDLEGQFEALGGSVNDVLRKRARNILVHEVVGASSVLAHLEPDSARKTASGGGD